jgi:hypothetical protein
MQRNGMLPAPKIEYRCAADEPPEERWFEVDVVGRVGTWNVSVTTNVPHVQRRMTHDDYERDLMVRPAAFRILSLAEMRDRIKEKLDRVVWKVERERRSFGVCFVSSSTGLKFTGTCYVDIDNRQIEVYLKTILAKELPCFETDYPVRINPAIEVVFSYDPEDEELKALIVDDLRQRLSQMSVGQAYTIEMRRMRYAMYFVEDDLVVVDYAERKDRTLYLNVA